MKTRRACQIALFAVVAASVFISEGSARAQVEEEPSSPGALRGVKGAALVLPPASALSLRLPRSALAGRDEGSGGRRTRRPDASHATPWGKEQSHVIPALEIVAFQTLLNLFDRAWFGCCDFDSDLSSIRRNLRSSWEVDDSTFTVNQLGHPYQGSIYHGFARASGLNYWEGLAYTFAGSALWEIAGETTPPSKNDQITTGVGGTFLGEALFRMSHLWLEHSKGSPLWRELGAAAISPPVGLNRLAFGERFRGIYPAGRPPYYSRLQFGATTATLDRPAPPQGVKRTEGVVDFALDYGLPGKPGYGYRRPFDYFSFQASTSTATGFDSVTTHGLLLGADYGGHNHHGIWGLYGSYDYLAPQVFRLASTALSLGTTAAWRPSPALAVRASALVGVGYATVSTVADAANESANHYGVAPQALLRLRLFAGERAAFEASVREYFVSDVSAGPRGGDDSVVRAEASFTWRIDRQQGITVRYQLSRRDADFPDLGERVQRRETLGIFYTILSGRGFGMRAWR